MRAGHGRHNPGQPVDLSLEVANPSAGMTLEVTYRSLSEVIATEQIIVGQGTATSWLWQPPETDYRGYTVDIRLLDGSTVLDREAIAVDVSSDWAKFPRYGFISDFGFLSASRMDEVIDQLTRHHINGLQFYDWKSTHHKPLEGTPENPDFSWRDIANRRHYANTVEGYVTRAQERNMMAMSYNLLYGANEDADAVADGVSPDWFLYRDPSQTTQDIHPLPSGWKSDVTLVDPYNAAWREYIATTTADAIQAFGFDGWHVDQLGDRGQVYAANGRPIDLAPATGNFVSSMKSTPALSDLRYVANAVNQYGQTDIANAPVDFLYTEVWQPNEQYNDLAAILMQNHAASNGQLNSVLAAYMNYNHADNPGTFNTPAVLMTDAVIFAFGGAHIELGEHMLSKEYFPNNTLAQTSELQDRLVHYYDFLVGYQNLLRDGGSFGTHTVSSPTHPLNNWPAQQGSIATVSKTVGDREIFHLINFVDATHMNWRDTNATQTEPSEQTNVRIEFHTQRTLNHFWTASPDSMVGLPEDLAFTQAPNGFVQADVPSLKIWTMLVAEGDATAGYDHAGETAYGSNWDNGTDGGLGFGPWTLRASATSGGFAGFFSPEDPSGLDNTGSGDASTGRTLASFANKGSGVEKATAFRNFDQPLDGYGDSFRLTLEHGLVTGEVGLTLRSTTQAQSPDDFSNSTRFRLFIDGLSSTYQIIDGDGLFDTGVPITPFGLSAEIELLDADSYNLTLWSYQEQRDYSPSSFTFTERLLASSGAIESFALYQFDAPSGPIQDDVYWNHFSIRLGPSLSGDLDGSGALDVADLDLLFAAIEDGNADLDLTNDGLIDSDDAIEWVSNLFGSKPGDANLDRIVDLIDLSVLASNFGQSVISNSHGDFNADRSVDLIDLSILASNFGFDGTVPEPSALIIAMLTGLPVMGCRRRTA
ncbi:glycoside hydrolase family 66 protein [Mucisphaera sp.]|uniref:glycoside hydrolase family 66 protein n=1 Tax=Mucisphaera sp. TaxID=2913024 RepID=UPI003D133437